ncbi:hypothetical protein NQ317_011060 [Molorchus minor]|uniref:Uncharacterized protein n=1 Tax=Molorchus minor TaxID=1323400 RepID=A0ABQ9IQE8_9CUCU|nr:hypothetical protein NQ317_011060 [Molorchus minor]
MGRTHKNHLESHIHYGIVGWGGTYNSHIKQLEVIQKMFIKIIYNRNNVYSSDLLYTESKILDVRQIFLYKMLILQHKKRTDLIPIQHEYNTRHKKKL